VFFFLRTILIGLHSTRLPLLMGLSDDTSCNLVI
jgi:hypothetical protein